MKKKRNTKEYNELFKKLDIDETYTKSIKQPIVYEKIKDLTVPLQDYNFQSDILMLPKTKNDFRYLLTVVDLWSDEIDAEPLKTKESAEVLKALKDIFKRPHLNKPYTIRTDFGKEFQGRVKEYLFEESILHSVSLPGRHRQTGSIENVNKLLSRFLMTYLANKEQQLNQKYMEWTDIIKNLIKELNLIRKRPDGDPYAIKASPDLDMIAKAKFTVGQLVYRRLDIPKDGLNNEQIINPKFRMGDMRFDLSLPRKIVKVVYYPNNVRYMLTGLPNVSYTDRELKLAAEKEELYAVKKIWNKKTEKNRVFYLVWWKHELKKQSTWVPKTQLIKDGLQNEIIEYDKSVKKKK